MNVFGLSMITAVVLASFASCAEPACAAPADMARIPAGRYSPLFREKNDPPVILIKAFLLDVLPVTNADYLEFVTANPKWRRSAVAPQFADRNYLKHWASDLDFGQARSNGPVIYVSWFAAKAFAAWKGKRLPTRVWAASSPWRSAPSTKSTWSPESTVR